ncbi:MAG: TonB-dependent receptor [Muribaculaceae bacterium]|nr:TonB-dependent receptor [Muribaculaceae bacterium]
MKKTITALVVLFAIIGNVQAPAATKMRALPDSIASESPDSTAINYVLDNVTVTAQRPLIKQEIDRIDYDVQADEDSKTQTVMDILRKVPLVSVDGSDEIFVKGEKNFKIYKNGHYDMSLSKNAKNVLKAMPAASIKRIEVITDPGAREDAESGDAILNIVMMDTKKMEGITGTVNSSCNMRTAPSVSTYLTSQFGKAIISVDYGFIHFTDRNNVDKNHTEQTFVETGNTITTDAIRYSPGHIQFADISASYDIDSLNLVTASFGGYFQKNNRHGNATTNYLNPNGDIFSHYDESYHDIHDNRNFWSGRLDFEHRSRLEDEKLTLSYMFNLSNCDDEMETTYSDIQNAQFDYSGIHQYNHERFIEHTIQLDYIRPLWAGQKLQTGTKFIGRDNDSEDEQIFYGEPSSTTDGSFSHKSYISALYADYIWKKGNWSARAGLRYEHSYMKGHYPDGKGPDFSQHLNDWVPQASVKYQIAPLKSLKLSYNTSINRPGIYYLDPYVKTTPTTVEFGNANLGSTRNQSVSLAYMQIGQRLTFQITLQYKFYNNGIDQIDYAEGDIRYITYDAVRRQRRLQVDGYVQYKPFKATTIGGNMSFAHYKMENTFQKLATIGNYCSYFFSINQELPWKLRATMLVYGTFGKISSIYFENDPYYAYRFTIQRSFLSEDRLSLSFSIHTPFRKDLCWTTRYTQGDIIGFSNDYNKGDSRQFVIAASYRFGNLKANVKRTDSTINNSDLEGGLSR